MSKMTDSESIKLMLYINLIPPTVGISLWACYKVLVRFDDVFPLALGVRKLEIASMVSGFSYTMLGLLAAVITILFTFTESEGFKQYQRRKNLRIFMSLYLMTVLCLVANAFLALYNFSPRDTHIVFNAMLVMFVVNIVQSLLVALAIFGIVRKALPKAQAI